MLTILNQHIRSKTGIFLILASSSDLPSEAVIFGLITDLDLADDAVVFAETTEDFAGALESLSEEAESLGLRVSLDQDQGSGVQ